MDGPGPETNAEEDAEYASPEAPLYALRLYITGKTPNSLRAITCVKEICERHFPGRYQLQVVDLYQQPALAEGDQIVVAPTLVKRSPAPLRRVMGNLSDSHRVLSSLDLHPTIA
ncbi:MAG TPA: circadian clock KaiB family protein [Thermoanaerobaculia bacterium]|jgi:circadian clock protein KaiB|nr:circadian clock KaiB family protein [Thermoanaerobaculia bacterium]